MRSAAHTLSILALTSSLAVGCGASTEAARSTAERVPNEAQGDETPAESSHEAPSDEASPTDEGSSVVEGIRSIAENTYEIDGDAPTFASSLAPHARFVPQHEGDAIVGLRVFGVRPGSVFATLGFLNGDTFTRIDDVAVTRIEQMGELFADEGFTRRVVVVLRRGQPLTLTYVRAPAPP